MINVIDASLYAQLCSFDSDCWNGFGVCTDGHCSGFVPDLSNARLFKCVDGYTCNVSRDQLPGLTISTAMRVRAISYQQECSTSAALKTSDSFFASNEWSCDETISNYTGCALRPGVSMKQSSITSNVVKLCGCPNVDRGGDNYACNQNLDFNVPLGSISLVECTSNSHCIYNNALAYCTASNTCAGFSTVAGMATLYGLQCAMNTECNISTMAVQYMTEAFKVIPVQYSATCGSAVLDPDYINSESLPCLFDSNNDGVCDVNLGVFQVTETKRLCGCSGLDYGGDGIPCNEAADFNENLGYVSIGECSLTSNCKSGNYCFSQRCVPDSYPPAVVEFTPQKGGFIVPPLTEIVFEFNENIQIGSSGKRILIETLSLDTPNTNNSLPLYSIILDQPTSDQIVTIRNYKLKIIPSVKLGSAGLPSGSYRVYYESRIVADMQGNENTGASDYYFTISPNAGCPVLYIAGMFPGDDSNGNINPNGLYAGSNTPYNGKALWTGASSNNKGLYIYWRPGNTTSEWSGNWVMDRDLSPGQDGDKSTIFAYSDPNSLIYAASDQRPPSGDWFTVVNGSFRIQNITMTCKKVDSTSPTLLDALPYPGQISYPVDGPFELTFSESMVYGHSGYLKIASLTDGSSMTLTSEITDGFRGRQVIANSGPVVHIFPPTPLKFGHDYEITSATGFLTDTAYNPWVALPPGILTFRAYGSSCPVFSLSDSVDLLVVRSVGTTEHLAEKHIQCAHSGFGPPANFSTPYIVYCLDGSWNDYSAYKCYPGCDSHKELASYLEFKTANPTYSMHGSIISIGCKSAYSPVNQLSSIQNVTCQNGIWSSVTLQCSSDCGNFTSFDGIFFSANYKVSGYGISKGDKRVISCANGASPFDLKTKKSLTFTSETLICNGIKWPHPTLKCNQSCPSTFPFGISNATVTGSESGLFHGAYRRISCVPGYGNIALGLSTSNNFITSDIVFPSSYQVHNSSFSTPIFSYLSSCTHGVWSSPGVIKCERICQRYLPPSTAYKIVSTSPENPRRHGSVLELACSGAIISSLSSASALSTGVGSVTCNYGVWTAPTITCELPCAPISDSLGTGFVDSTLKSTTDVADNSVVNVKFNTTHFRPGTTRVIKCSVTAVGDTTLESSVICQDGTWIDNQTKSVTSIRCYRKCEPLSLMSSEGYTGQVTSLVHGTSVSVTCLKGWWVYYIDQSYSSSSKTMSHVRTRGSSLSGAVWTCSDGKWGEAEGSTSKLVCMKSCKLSDLATIMTRSFNYVIATPSSTSQLDSNGDVVSGVTIQLACLNGLRNRGGSEMPICEDGVWHLGNYFCEQPLCDDFILNGDETDVDCGGSCNACPTCQDGIINGDETGIDCGGSCRFDCPVASSCSDKIRNGDEASVDCGGSCGASSKCSTCYDGLKNGDETGIDCGGSCRACFTCHANTTSSTIESIFTNETTITYESYQIPDPSPLMYMEPTNMNLFARTPHGFAVFGRCHPGSSLVSIGSFERPFGVSGALACSDGRWHVLFGCEPSSCTDGVQNGDETAMDCGGSCEPCSSCSDGIQNGDEDGVDCGGSCASLTNCNANCDMRTIKNFAAQPSLYIVTPLPSESPRGSWSISCANSAVSVGSRSATTVQCTSRGTWSATVEDEIHCVHSSVATSSQSSIEGVLNLNPAIVPSSSEGASGRGFEAFISGNSTVFGTEAYQLPLAVFSVPPYDCGSILQGGCCALRPSIRAFIESNASCKTFFKTSFALIVEGGSAPSVSLKSSLQNFCVNENCISSLRSRLNSFESTYGSSEVGCSDIKRIRDVLDAICTADPFKNEFCLFNFRQDRQLMTLRALDHLTSSEMESLCPLISDAVQSTSTISTKNICFAENLKLYHAIHLLANPDFLGSIRGYSNPHAFVRTATANCGIGVTCPLSSVTKSYTTSIPTASRGTALTPLGANQPLTPDLLRLACMKVESNSFCHWSLARTFAENPLTFRTGTYAQLCGSSSSTSSSGGATANLSLEEASLRCIPLMARMVGRLLVDEGGVEGQATGRLLSQWGFYVCSKNHFDRSCGDEVLGTPPLLPLPRRNASSAVSFDSSLTGVASNFGSCTLPCLAEFVGDNICDAQCFNAECGFDGGDCEPSNSFSHIYSSVAKTMQVSNSRSLYAFNAADKCDPLSVNFDCLGSCYTQMVSVLSSSGCCMASALSTYSELTLIATIVDYMTTNSLLSIPKDSNDYLAIFKSFIQSLDSVDYSGTRFFNRNPLWVENICFLGMDSSCAQNSLTTNLKISFSMKNAVYEDFMTSESAISSVRGAVAKSVSRLTGINERAVSYFYTWPGSIIVESGIVGNARFAASMRTALLSNLPFIQEAILSEVNNPSVASTLGLETVTVPLQLVEVSTSNFLMSPAGVSNPVAPLMGVIGVDDLVESGAVVLRTTACESSFDDSLGYSASIQIDPASGIGQAVIECRDGFRSSDSSLSSQTLSCQNGRWSPSTSQDRLVCVLICEGEPQRTAATSSLLSSTSYSSSSLSSSTSSSTESYVETCMSGWQVGGVLSSVSHTCQLGVWALDGILVCHKCSKGEFEAEIGLDVANWQVTSANTNGFTADATLSCDLTITCQNEWNFDVVRSQISSDKACSALLASKSRNIGLIIGIIVACCVLVAGVVGFYIWTRRKAGKRIVPSLFLKKTRDMEEASNYDSEIWNGSETVRRRRKVEEGDSLSPTALTVDINKSPRTIVSCNSSRDPSAAISSLRRDSKSGESTKRKSRASVLDRQRDEHDDRYSLIGSTTTQKIYDHSINQRDNSISSLNTYNSSIYLPASTDKKIKKHPSRQMSEYTQKSYLPDSADGTTSFIDSKVSRDTHKSCDNKNYSRTFVAKSSPRYKHRSNCQFDNTSKSKNKSREPSNIASGRYSINNNQFKSGSKPAF